MCKMACNIKSGSITLTVKRKENNNNKKCQNTYPNCLMYSMNKTAQRLNQSEMIWKRGRLGVFSTILG